MSTYYPPQSYPESVEQMLEHFAKAAALLKPKTPGAAKEPPRHVNLDRLNRAVRGGAAFTADYQPLNRAAHRFLKREEHLNRRAIAADKKYAPLA